MANELKWSISGLRGIWGENLNEKVVCTHIEAYALFLQKHGATKVILGRDSRISGSLIKNIAIDILVRAGFEVVDAGIIPTPTIIFLIRTKQFDGGIMISASHNPPEYNGLKFFNKEAFYINEIQLSEIKSYLYSNAESKEGGRVTGDFDMCLGHVEHVLGNIDVSVIKDKKFNVVIDTINGAGYRLGPLLLERLGASVTVINGTPDGNFAHMPEPLAVNLVGLSEKVKEVGADIGFAQDPDADRLVICDEKGEVVLEEYMLSLAIKNILEKTPGDIVTNLSTSNTNKDLVESFGFKNYRTKVGEGNVVEGIIKHNAVIGGEGSGGVIYPSINLCRDSLVGIGLILELLARNNMTLSEMIKSLPKYESVKTKMPWGGSLENIIERVIKEFPQGKANTEDGVRIDFADSSWVQIRGSNTEPIIRIWSEARDKNTAENLVNKIKSLM